MKIVFMGTPDFAEESLKAIYEAGHEIIGVVTNPDRPKGRGMKMIPSPVKEFAMENHLTIYQPEKVKNNEEFANNVTQFDLLVKESSSSEDVLTIEEVVLANYEEIIGTGM